MIQNARTSVVSLCTWAQRDVWKITSAMLPEKVEADHYKVYVPEGECVKFAGITDSRVRVIAETELALDFANPLKEAVSSAGNSKRYGWYFQQFLKIQAMLEDESDNIIIWDSDCVPISSVRFFDVSGRAKLFTSPEYHEGYFPPIQKLLDLNKSQKASFIAPGFAMKKAWVGQIVSEIEKRHGVPWFQALIASTDFSLRSGFSEYETLGTWLVENRPDVDVSPDLKWERLGQSKFGYPRRLGVDGVSERGESAGLDVVSFENWDYIGIRRAIYAARFLKELFNGKKILK